MRPIARLRRLATASALLAAALTLSHCDLFEDGLDIPIAFTHTLTLRADLGAATGAAAGQQAPQDVTYPLGMGAVPVDLIAASSQLAANRSKVQRIAFTQITVTPTTNTLTSATPAIDLYIGPAGATTAAQGIKIATLPPIPAGSTAATTATIDAAGQDQAQTHLLSFDFTVIPVAQLTVKAGQTVPGGAADLDVTLGITATLNPIK